MNKTAVVGGEGGIRTPGTLARTPHFECGAIDHSATSPGPTAMSASLAAGSARRLAWGVIARKARLGRAPGQNPKSLSGEELCSEAGVDAGSEALSADGAACLIGFEEVVAGVSDDGEVQRRGVFCGSAAVFVERHVQRPVENLDSPMGARCGENGLGAGFEGRDVIAGLEAFAAGFLVDASGGDGGDGTQAFPVGMAFGE